MLILSLASVLLLSVSAKNDAELSADQLNGVPQIFDPNTNPIQLDLDSHCLDCICLAETGCNLSAQCSADGTVCGPFQISSAYFQDCCSYLNLGNCDSYSAFKACALDYNCAYRCVRAYLEEYSIHCLASGCRGYARIHKGGPDGCSISETIQFGNDVMHYCDGADHNPYVYPCTSDDDCFLPGYSGDCIPGVCDGPPNPDQNTWTCFCSGAGSPCSDDNLPLRTILKVSFFRFMLFCAPYYLFLLVFPFWHRPMQQNNTIRFICKAHLKRAEIIRNLTKT